MALAAEEDEQCPGCSGQLTETTDAEHEFAWKAEAIRCHRCATQQREIREHQKSGDPTGLLVIAHRSDE